MKTMKRVTISLLKNGSLLKAVRCGNNFIVVRETCAFDSLTQVITNAIATNEAYDVITNENNNFCNFAKSISIMNSIRVTSNIYQERAKIISNIPIFEMQLYRNVMHLSTNCNVAHLAECLFANFPSLNISKKCQHCNYENLRKVLVVNININIILQNSLSELRNAIIDTNNDRVLMCKECNQSVVGKYNFLSHLLVDCSVFTDKRYAASIGIEKKMRHSVAYLKF